MDLLNLNTTGINAPKKVVRIIARLNVGGPAIHTILLTKWLNREKFDSVLVSGALGKDEGDMSYLAERHDVHPVIIPELMREINWKKDAAALWKIYRQLCRHKPDILHTHTAKAGTLGRTACILYNLRNRILLKSRCIIIHTFHGHVLHSYFSRLKTFIFIIIERALAGFTDAIVVISEKQKKDIADRYKIADDKKIHIIPLGFDLASFFNCEENNKGFKKELSIDDEATVIGIIGRLAPIKNHKLFLNTAKRLSSIDDKLIFVIIGDGECKSELLSYADKLDIKDRVIFAGWKKDIYSVYDGLDIVALTSFNEGTPVSLIEAMASKKPVIATDVGGVGDIFSFKENIAAGNGFLVGENGVLVKENNIESFSNGLKLLLSSRDIRERMGIKGREFVRERFSIARLVQDIENLYEIHIRHQPHKWA